MNPARWFLVFGFTASACNGPDLNLGDSNAAAGQANVPVPAAGSGNQASNVAGSSSGLGGAGSSASGGNIGDAGAGNGGAAGALPPLAIPEFESLSEPGYSGLRAVYVGTDDSIWVGANNGIHSFADGAWGDVERPGEDIGQLWGEGTRPLYASGRRAVYEYDAGSWRDIGTFDCTAFLKISVTPNYVYVACPDADQRVARIARAGSAGIEPAPSLTLTTRALWSFGESALFAWVNGTDSQGSPGFFQVFEGGTWSAAASWHKEELQRGTSAEGLNALWSPDGSSLLLVGEGGNILRRRLGTWSKETVPTTQSLHAAWGSLEDGEFAVGDGGTIVFHDRQEWHAVSAPSGAPLYAIHGQRNGLVVAVGESNTVLAIVR